jgi:DNA-binding FadR family transcriptional regulator
VTDRPTFSRLNAVPRSAQVREQLEEAIRRGDYNPGERLPSERELSEMFGVSRVSVREAVRSLEAIGLIDVRHGLGSVVTDPATRAGRDLRRWVEHNRDEALDLLRVRGALDELAAEEAADGAGPASIAAVRAAHQAFAAAVATGDADGLKALDVAFHTAIADASGSKLLRDLLVDLHEHLADSRSISFARPDRPPQSAAEHAAIVEAIETGDGDGARRATKEHIERVRRVLDASLDDG